MLNHNYIYYFRLAIAALLALAMSACDPTLRKPSGGATATDKALVGEAKAEAMLLQAAKANVQQASSMRLEAAQIYMDAKKNQLAAVALLEVSPDSSNALLWQRDLLLAELYLRENNASQAMQLLREPASGVDAALRMKYLQAKFQAQDMLGDTMGAIRTIAAGGESSLYDQLWQKLKATPLSELKQEKTIANDTYSGWVELSIIDRDLADSAENWSTAIIFWLQQYPTHPAQQVVLPTLRQQNYQRHRSAGQVAVLLPRSGALLNQASSIEYGMLSAWYSDEAEQLPVLKFYDTGKTDIEQLYQRAVQDGAELVIGPLMRENVDVISAMEDLPVPVLALNTSTAGVSTNSNYHEFALSVEDEIGQIAQKAWFDGNQAALVLVTDSAYGQRLERTISDKWQELGGLIVSSEILADNQDDIKEQLSELLHVRISKLRIEQLEETLGIPLTAPNRGRGDVGCIFLAAPGDIARQVGPQIRFLDLEHVQVYATSDIYHGDISNESALDMDLMQFPIMPWLLDPEPTGGDDMQTIGAKVGSPELFAFGIDAYNVGLQLGKLTATKDAEYPGQTGSLRFSGHKINRKMTWAIFYGGAATTLSLYEQSQDTQLQRQ